eukprot:gene49-140_t
MPRTAKYSWIEDATSITFDVSIPAIKADKVDILVAGLYVKVNHPPDFFEADLVSPVDPDHEKTKVMVTKTGVKLVLRKENEGIWSEYKAKGEKSELRTRRQQSIEEHQKRLEEKVQAKKDRMLDLQKSGEREMWAVDRKNKDTVAEWKDAEKKKAEQEVFGSFDSGPERKALENVSASSTSMIDRLREGDGREEAVIQESEVVPPAPASPPLARRKSSLKGSTTDGKKERRKSVGWADEETSGRKSLVQEFSAEAQKHDFAPPPRGSISPPRKPISDDIFDDDSLKEKLEEVTLPVRKGPEKIGLRFSERALPGVPARDRPDREPPKPKGKIQRPKLHGEDDHLENDPVFLKDKADKFMIKGDYEAARNAYTSALVHASNSRAFANRSIANLYLGEFTKCIEDCNHAISVMTLRAKAQEKGGSAVTDARELQMKARILLRIGVCYLWMGNFSKAEANMLSALAIEDGFTPEEKEKVNADIERIRLADEVAPEKIKVDRTLKRTLVDEAKERDIEWDPIVDQYEELADKENGNNAIVLSNQCLASLQAGNLQKCIDTGMAALRKIAEWPWVKDSEEKSDDAYIALKRKLTKEQKELIKQRLEVLQGAVYNRDLKQIKKALGHAITEGKDGLGVGAEALDLCNKYCKKLREYEEQKASEKKQEKELAEKVLKQTEENPQAEAEEIAAFPKTHPLEKSRRRLRTKIRLRRGKAFERLGKVPEAIAEIQAALTLEPKNGEAQNLLRMLRPLPLTPEEEKKVEKVNTAVEKADTDQVASADNGKKNEDVDSDDMSSDEEEDVEEKIESTKLLFQTATQYLKTGDFEGALQMCRYILNTGTFMTGRDGAMQKLRAHSNLTLALQKLRMPAKDLYEACNSALDLCHSDDVKGDNMGDVSKIECALLSRRGSALMQMGKTEAGQADAARVKELLRTAGVSSRGARVEVLGILLQADDGQTNSDGGDSMDSLTLGFDEDEFGESNRANEADGSNKSNADLVDGVEKLSVTENVEASVFEFENDTSTGDSVNESGSGRVSPASTVSSAPPISIPKQAPGHNDFWVPERDGCDLESSIAFGAESQAGEKSSSTQPLQLLGDGYNDLFTACRTGDAQIVQRILEDPKIDVNKSLKTMKSDAGTMEENSQAAKRYGQWHSHGFTPLMLAADIADAEYASQMDDDLGY